MNVAALRAQSVESFFKAKKVVDVQPTRATALADVGGEGLRVLWANKLVIVWGANVHKCADWLGAISWVERGVMDRVAVDLANVKVVLDLGNLVCLDAVGDTPDAFGCRVVVVG